MIFRLIVFVAALTVCIQLWCVFCNNFVGDYMNSCLNESVNLLLTCIGLIMGAVFIPVYIHTAIKVMRKNDAKK